jgi:hypothetical protein
MRDYWSRAIYDFGLSAKKFYQLTPKQFVLLSRRHREALAHAELPGAYTTAATINYSGYAPEKGVSPLDFMPNHRDSAPPRSPEELLTEEQLEVLVTYQQKVLQFTGELQAARTKKANTDGIGLPETDS